MFEGYSFKHLWNKMSWGDLLEFHFYILLATLLVAMIPRRWLKCKFIWQYESHDTGSCFIQIKYNTWTWQWQEGYGPWGGLTLTQVLCNRLWKIFHASQQMDGGSLCAVHASPTSSELCTFIPMMSGFQVQFNISYGSITRQNRTLNINSRYWCELSCQII